MYICTAGEVGIYGCGLLYQTKVDLFINQNRIGWNNKNLKFIYFYRFMLAVFRSAVDIVLYFENIENFREDGIRKVCSKNTNMYKGYYFEFTEEDVTINVVRLAGDSHES